MCYLCSEIIRDRITFKEVGIAMKEMDFTYEHLEELNKVIDEKFIIELPSGISKVETDEA